MNLLIAVCLYFLLYVNDMVHMHMYFCERYLTQHYVYIYCVVRFLWMKFLQILYPL